MINSEQFFYILIRHYKSFTYFDRCIDSVLEQTYRNYKILFVDDASGYSKERKRYIKNKLKNHIVIFNRDRKYSLFNAYYMIHSYAAKPNAVVLNLDGDDWLINSSSLDYLAKIYNSSDCNITYGECVIWDGHKYSKESRFMKKNTNIPYPKNITSKNMYRIHPFLPLHPLTWKVWLFKMIKMDDFLDGNGKFIQFAQDQAIFYPMIEMMGGKCKVIGKKIYSYNIETGISDIKRNVIDLIKDEITIRKKHPYEQL